MPYTSNVIRRWKYVHNFVKGRGTGLGLGRNLTEKPLALYEIPNKVSYHIGDSEPVVSYSGSYINIPAPRYWASTPPNGPQPTSPLYLHLGPYGLYFMLLGVS